MKEVKLDGKWYRVACRGAYVEGQRQTRRYGWKHWYMLWHSDTERKPGPRVVEALKAAGFEPPHTTSP